MKNKNKNLKPSNNPYKKDHGFNIKRVING